MSLSRKTAVGLLVTLITLVSCTTTPPQVVPDPAVPEFLTKAKSTADDYRKKALSIKAEVAAKETFNQGETGYASGTKTSQSLDFETAATQFNSASEFYKKAYEEALAKKQAAQKAMTQAEEDRKATEAALQEAQASGDTEK